MQAVSLLNLLLPSNATGTAAPAGLLGIGDGLANLLLPNAEGQFNGLLAVGDGKNSPDLAALLGTNPLGDTTTSPQVNGIAALLQPEQPLVNTNHPVLIQVASSGGIKSDVEVTSLDLSSIASFKQAPVNKAIANEVSNSADSALQQIIPVYQEKFSTRFNMGAEKNLPHEVRQGKIQLANISTETFQNPDADTAKIAQDYLQKRMVNAAPIAETAGSAEETVILKPKTKVADELSTLAKPDNAQTGDLSNKAVVAVDVASRHLDTPKKFDPQPIDAIDAHENLYDAGAKVASPHHADDKPKLQPTDHARTPVEQIQVKISQAISSGTDKIHIKLHPAELGGIDVSMDVDDAGNARIHIVADKASTLDLLRKDSADLEKSLQASGIKTETSGLEFSLRGDQQQKGQQFSGDMFGSPTTYKPLITSEVTKETTYIMGAGVDRVNILA